MNSVLPSDWAMKYQKFLEEDVVRKAIGEQDGQAFFSFYPRVVNQTVPKAALRVPLAKARIGLIATGGLHLKTDRPFVTGTLREIVAHDWRL